MELRAFLTAVLEAQGVNPGTRSLPYGLAYALAAASESFARMTGKAPMMTRMSVQLIGREVTLDDSKIRRELGYVGAVTREECVAEISAARRHQVAP